MNLTALSVWIQAISSGAFLSLYLLKTKWWANITNQVLVGMVTCLFVLTLDLAITSTDEGLLSRVPLPVLLARLGFTLCMLYGIIRLEIPAKGRKE